MTPRRKGGKKGLKMLRRNLRFFRAVALAAQDLDWRLLANAGGEAAACKQTRRTRVPYHFIALGSPPMRATKIGGAVPHDMNDMIRKRNKIAAESTRGSANVTAAAGPWLDGELRRQFGGRLPAVPREAGESLVDVSASFHFVDFAGLVRGMNQTALRSRSKDAKHFMCTFVPPYPRPVLGSMNDERGCHDDVNRAVWTWIGRLLLEMSRLEDVNEPGRVTMAETWVGDAA